MHYAALLPNLTLFRPRLQDDCTPAQTCGECADLNPDALYNVSSADDLDPALVHCVWCGATEACKPATTAASNTFDLTALTAECTSLPSFAADLRQCLKKQAEDLFSSAHHRLGGVTPVAALMSLLLAVLNLRFR
jgi:hypothetical protein